MTMLLPSKYCIKRAAGTRGDDAEEANTVLSPLFTLSESCADIVSSSCRLPLLGIPSLVSNSAKFVPPFSFRRPFLRPFEAWRGRRLSTYRFSRWTREKRRKYYTWRASMVRYSFLVRSAELLECLILFFNFRWKLVCSRTLRRWYEFLYILYVSQLFFDDGTFSFLCM